MTATDIDALHAELDESPACHFTRRALADAYEEIGDDVMAAGLRWMADNDRTPAKGLRSGRWKGWYWSCPVLPAHPGHLPRIEDLPRPVFDRLANHEPWPANTARCEKTYPTRREAEVALCRALWIASAEGVTL